MTMNRSVLLVDDDPNILRGYTRLMRNKFDIQTALGPKEGLAIAAQSDPFAVIITDMRMPEINGIQFLGSVRHVQPDSVCMMLTGNADQKTAMDAVNDGQIFRFLTKPCPTEILVKAIEAGIEQFRLEIAERDLLTKTLSGSICVLTDVLSLVNPTAFGQGAAIRRLAQRICRQLNVDNAWEIELAAALSQVGCVAIPESTLAKHYHGGALTREELEVYKTHPQVGHDLIAKIPRLKGVAEIILCQDSYFDGRGNEERKGNEIPLGSRILKVVLDANQLLLLGNPAEEVLELFRHREGWYDPSLVEPLARALDVKYITKLVTLDTLTEGSLLDEHVISADGSILLARGQEVTSSLFQRLQNYATSTARLQEPIRVRCPVGQCDVG